jgi:putative FmdB family regulatory protein
LVAFSSSTRRVLAPLREDSVPTYQYACTDCADRVEVVQRFTDDPLTVCAACGGRLRKVYSPVGIVFKGSGFYRTDSRNGAERHGSKDKQNASGHDSSSSGESGSGKDAGSSGKGKKQAESVGAGTGSKSGSSSGSSSSGSSSSGSSD